MFRPTHFVILFAVVLYANAFPADPSAPLPGGPIRGPEPGLAHQKPLAGSLSNDEPAKGDLATDATDYWGYRYNYYGPRWAGYEAPAWAGRAYGWPHFIY